MKLIEAVLHRALARDERTARGLILSGRVLVDDKSVTSEHAVVASEQLIRLRGDTGTDVSRGARKLRPAIERTGITLAGKVCLDLGVSTGGFTQVLLEHNATKVYAVDVSYGITAHEVRNDTRVTLLERTNARELTHAHIPEPVDCVVGDLSFIGWGAVIPAIVPLLSPAARLLLLVKPQFEIPPDLRDEALHNGVISDPRYWVEALFSLTSTWVINGLQVLQVFPSNLPGVKGNREFFVLLQLSAMAKPQEYEQMVECAVAEAASES
ncbi:MAG: TlyA family RNA methyltransferase [bacterium]|nr:TlyA family RNA methyltransferase [bacterium]